MSAVDRYRDSYNPHPLRHDDPPRLAPHAQPTYRTTTTDRYSTAEQQSRASTLQFEQYRTAQPEPSSSRQAGRPATTAAPAPARTAYTTSTRQPHTEPAPPPRANTVYSAASQPAAGLTAPTAPPAPNAAPTAAGVGAGTAPGKTDKGKLTEQWGPPPDQIRRDKEWLERGALLGEVSTVQSRKEEQLTQPRLHLAQGGFARVYLATEPSGEVKALKVIAKEQLKSTKNKSKVSPDPLRPRCRPSPALTASTSLRSCLERSRSTRPWPTPTSSRSSTALRTTAMSTCSSSSAPTASVPSPRRSCATLADFPSSTSPCSTSCGGGADTASPRRGFTWFS